MAGDTLTPELLLEHADWVRTLARSLVFDEDRVDDVVQETWVAALKAPPATTERLRGWLAAVVRNVARQTGRAEGRRRRRERATTPPPPGPSAAEVAGRAALQRELVDHVFALDEPYRDVVLLRYFEGLTPKRIAALRGTPTATVKTRLQRALERLRGRLDTEHGDRSAWCAALLPLAAKGGGVTVGAKGLAAAAACALLAGTWFATDPAPRESASAAAPAALAPSSEEPLDESTDRGERATSRNDGIPRADEAPSRDAVPSATPTPADDAPHRLAGRVIDERGRPLGGVTVRAVDPDALRWQDERETTLVGRSFWMPLPKERRDALRADLASLDAFVAREFTDPVAARALILGGEPPVVSTRTAPDGSFVLEARTTSARARVVDPRWCIVGEAKPPPPEDAALLVVVPSVRVAGTVLDRDDRPVVGAEVTLRCSARDLPHLPPGLEWHLLRERTWRTTSGVDGRFELRDVAGHRSAAIGALRLPFGGDSIRLPDAGREELVLRVDAPTWVLESRTQDAPTITIEGTVSHAGGGAVAGAVVRLGDAETRTDARGRYELIVEESPFAATGTLWAVEPDVAYAAAPDFLGGRFPLAAERFRADLTLTSAFRSLTGRVVDEDGNGLAGVDVELLGQRRTGGLGRTIESLHGGRRFGRVVTGAEGRFTHGGLLDREYSLSATLEDVGAACGPIAAGASDVVLRLPAARTIPRVAGVVVDRRGAPLEGVAVGIGRARTTTDAEGRWSLADVSARQDLVASGPGLERRRWTPDDWTALETPRLVLFRPCRVELVPGGAAADAFALLDAGGGALKLRRVPGDTISRRVALGDDGAVTADATDAAEWLVLYRGDEEVRRTRIALDPARTVRIVP